MSPPGKAPVERAGGQGACVPTIIKRYVRFVDAMNYRIGRIAMYMVFVLIGILLWSSISKTFFNPSLWTVELAQFVMVTYFIVGGPYSIQLGSNVRMDLFYGSWTPTTKAWVDAFSVFCLIFYLCVLLYGAWISTAYSLEYGERNATAWRPHLWPVKIVITFGIFLMLLQAVAELFRDIAHIRGEEL
jgi:TRAP-type mannitol/chloroaromatic compound transport system permease small subunit